MHIPWKSVPFSFGLVRLGLALVAFALPLLYVGKPLAAWSPVTGSYLGFSLLSLLVACWNEDEHKQLLIGGFLDAIFIGTATATYPTLPLLLGTPALTLAAAWSLPLAAWQQVAGQHALALSMSWLLSGWNLSANAQAVVALYLVSSSVAIWFRQRDAEFARAPDPTPDAATRAELLYNLDSNPLPPSAIGDRPVLLLHGKASDSTWLSQLVRGWGSRLETASDLAGLVAKAYTHAERPETLPSAVIVDHRGRNEDPLQILQIFKESPQLATIRLVLLVGENESTQAHRLRQSGFAAILSSPLDKTLLFNALHEPVAIRQQSGVASLLDHYLRARNPMPPLEILLAMPAQMQLKVTKRLLERDGHSVYITSSGEQALDALTSHRFDLALVHFDLPDMDGFELTRIYRLTHPEQRATPLVMLANQVSADIHLSAKQAGAKGLLTLPLHAQSVRNLQRKLMAAEAEGSTAPNGQLILDAGAEVEALNLETLRDLEELGNGLAFVQELVDSFIAESSDLIRDIRSTMDNQDLASFRDCVQALAGSAGSVGASQLQHFCNGLSAIGVNEFRLKASSLLHSLEDATHRAHQALLRHIDERAGSVSRS